MTTVETERLRLRPWRCDDLEPLAAIHAVPEFWWYPLGRGQTREETEHFLERRLTEWEARGYDLWAAELKEGRELIGWIGLSVPAFLPEILPAVEVGWRLHPAHWGRGLATEGGAASLRFGFDQLDLDRIVSIYDPANVRSGAVMQRLGMRFERDTTIPVRGFPARVMEITYQAWCARESGSGAR